MIEEEDPDDLSIQVTAFDDEANEVDIEIDINDESNNNNNSNTMSDSARNFGMITTSQEAATQIPPPTEFQKFVTDLQQKMLKFPREVRNLVAGGLAGMLAKSIVAPFDRIKILYQVSSAHFHLWKVPQIAYRIVKEEGLSALWKGNTATLVRVFPYSGIQFMVFDRCKTFMLKEQEIKYLTEKDIAIRSNRQPPPKPKWGLSPVESLCAGMVAGATSVVATYPLDLTRAQLAVLRTKKNDVNSKSKHQGFVSTLVDNYRSRGTVGLFRGITPTLIGILPYSGLAFAFNEQGKRKVHGTQNDRPELLLWYLLCLLRSFIIVFFGCQPDPHTYYCLEFCFAVCHVY